MGYSNIDILVDDYTMVLQYDDTFEGFLTAVYMSYKIKPVPQKIVGREFQSTLFTEVKYIETDLDLVEKVIDGINKTMGNQSYYMIWVCYLSDEEDKNTLIFQFIRSGMRKGKSFFKQLAIPIVLEINNLFNSVTSEKHRTLEFLRFSKTKKGIYYGKITPKANTLPLIMPFFVDRFRTMPFIIHDIERKVAGISDTKEWSILEVGDADIPDLAEGEDYIRHLWKCFYDNIAISQKTNPKLRMQHMPKRLWKNITEMNMPDTDVTPENILKENIKKRLES